MSELTSHLTSQEITSFSELYLIKVIKKGSGFFDLCFEMIAFRDAMNYTGPMSLAKFAKVFKLEMEKSIMAYEAFESIEEVRNQIDWPTVCFQKLLQYRSVLKVFEC